jgi:hypothetical protein
VGAPHMCLHACMCVERNREFILHIFVLLLHLMYNRYSLHMQTAITDIFMEGISYCLLNKYEILVLSCVHICKICNK